MKLLMVSVWLMVAAVAEPPAFGKNGSPAEAQETSENGRAPGSSYGPPSSRPQPRPSSQYGAPAEAQETSEHGRAPASSYGPPSSRPQPRPSSQYGAPSSGYGNSEDENPPANYEFQYDVSDQEAGLKFGHQEQRDGEVTRGRYYVLLPDGRTQTVEYTADQDGYRPKISYEGGEGYK